MKKLVTLLIVLVVCLPCYGEVLVYKTKQKGAAFNFNNWSGDNGRYQKEKASGFLLFDVDIDSGRISWIYNAWPIMYGQNPQTRQKAMVSYILEPPWIFYGTSKGKTNAVIFSLAIALDPSIEHLDPNENFYLGSTFIVEGTVKRTSLIKGGAKISIPASLKGSLHYDLFLEDSRTVELLTVNMRLDKKWTARANDPDDLGGELAVYDTFLAIHDYLVDSKGYPPLY